jgi:DNA invertase Pin-like site-specific DNA recombinase
MPLAAVYARKSTEQSIADEEKSVTRQVELALACAKQRGFDVPAEHIYVDDAISGAEFGRRPGLVRLLNALRPRAPFAALFLADKDRLGREQFETNHILKQVSLAGVRIFEYQNGGHEVRLESPIDKLIMSVSNFAAELERAKASQRTRDALQIKAQRAATSPAAPSSATATFRCWVKAIAARTSSARSARTRRRPSGGSSRPRPRAWGCARSR